MIKIQYVDTGATHSKDFVFDVPEGHERWLVLLTRTAAMFEVDGIMTRYPANSAIIYRPHQKILYQACEDTYVNDWIRFATDEDFIHTPHLPHGVPFPVNDPKTIHKLYELILNENIFDHEYKEVSLDSLMRLLFIKLIESYNQKSVNPLHTSLSELKREIHKFPNNDWSLKMMSEKLNISIGYLELIYKEAFGISCIDDVISSRINMAKKLLIYTQYPISNISERCGYKSIEHFYRQFKKNTGLTPSIFRKKHIS